MVIYTLNFVGAPIQKYAAFPATSNDDSTMGIYAAPTQKAASWLVDARLATWT
jgi:hypothetical protein